MQNTVVLGLTGQTGAGKSTVGDYLRRRGAAWVDADEVAHDVTDNEKVCLADLALEFSIDILHVDGTLNRRRLGEIVFGDKAKLRRLNEIVFPYIIEAIRRELDRLKAQGASLIVLDAPTLFESGADRFCDVVVSVVADTQLRTQRIVQRDALSLAEAEARVNAQHKESYYVKRSDYVLENNDSVESLKLKVADMMEKIESGEYDSARPLSAGRQGEE